MRERDKETIEKRKRREDRDVGSWISLQFIQREIARIRTAAKGRPRGSRPATKKMMDDWRFFSFFPLCVYTRSVFIYIHCRYGVGEKRDETRVPRN